MGDYHSHWSMWSMLTHSHYTKVDSAHRLANTHHVTERCAFSTSLRNKNLKFDYKQPLAPWPSHNRLSCLGQFPCSAWGIYTRRQELPAAPPTRTPDQCGYACLLCLNSGSVAPLLLDFLLWCWGSLVAVWKVTQASHWTCFYQNITTSMCVCVFCLRECFLILFYSCNPRICSICPHYTEFWHWINIEGVESVACGATWQRIILSFF